MQLDLFNEKIENKPNTTEGTKICKDCKEEKIITEFRTAYWGKGGNRIYCNQCKACHNKAGILVRTLKKLNPKPKDGKCQACGEVPDVLHLDHDHTTDKFRGWVCEGCNHSMGKSNDDPEKLIKQAEYLRERSSK
jgi:hypothetical protein